MESVNYTWLLGALPIVVFLELAVFVLIELSGSYKVTSTGRKELEKKERYAA